MTRKKLRNTNTWRLSNLFLNNQQGTEEIKWEIKTISTNVSENTTTQNLWEAAKAVLNFPKKEVYSNTILPQETRKTSNRWPNFTPQTTGRK